MNASTAQVYLDENVDVLVARLLVVRRLVATSAWEQGHLGWKDSQQLAFAASRGFVLVTHDFSDFSRLHNEYVTQNIPHSGILLAIRRKPNEIAARIAKLMESLSADQFVSQLFYV